MKADTLTQAPPTPQPGGFTKPRCNVQKSQAFSVQYSNFSSSPKMAPETTHGGLVSFPQFLKLVKLDPIPNLKLMRRAFLQLWRSCMKGAGLFFCTTAGSWLTSCSQCVMAIGAHVHFSPGKGTVQQTRGTFMALPWLNWQRAKLQLVSLVIPHPSGCWADVLQGECEDTQPPEQSPWCQLRPQTHCHQQNCKKSPIYPPQPRDAGLVWLGRRNMHIWVGVGALTELMEVQSLAAEL